MDELGLTTTAAYDAQGNAFDHRAVAARVGPAVRTWLGGGELPQARWPGVLTLRRLFADVRATIPDGSIAHATSDTGHNFTCAWL